MKKPNHTNYKSLKDFMVDNNKFLVSIGFAPDTLDDLNSQGIFTPYDLAHYEMSESYIELHNDIMDFRPTGVEKLSLSVIKNKYNELFNDYIADEFSDGGINV